MKRKLALVKKSASAAKPGPKGLLSDLREMILTTRQTVAQGVNSALVLLYWKIGQRIQSDILKQKRGDYGKQIFYALSRKLTTEFGRGFSQANLFHMVRFAEVFPDVKIMHALSALLSWTHLRRDNVAQVVNLLYRRMVFGKTCLRTTARRIANPRYSRLPVQCHLDLQNGNLSYELRPTRRVVGI